MIFKHFNSTFLALCFHVNFVHRFLTTINLAPGSNCVWLVFGCILLWVVIVLHRKNSDCWRPLAAEGSSVYTCVQRVLRVHMCTHDSSQTAPPSGSPPYTHVYSTHGTHDSSPTASPSGSPPCTHVYKRSSPYTCVLGFSELLILNSNP